MRLFVALTPPAEPVEELWSAVAGVRSVVPDLRWTRPEQWHVTLAFLGEVNDNAIDELTRRLGRVAARHAPVSLAFGGGGRFGHRVLWIAVQGDRAGLCRLADSARAAARRSGLQVDQRPYRPHLTLARAPAGANLQPVATQLASWQGLPWVGHHLQLVRSRLGAGPEGTALHDSIGEWQLGG